MSFDRCIDVLNTPAGTFERFIAEAKDEFSMDEAHENISSDKSRIFDFVFIDINGNRMLEAVAEAVAIVRASLNPRLIVVKSSELVCALQSINCTGNRCDLVLGS